LRLGEIVGDERVTELAQSCRRLDASFLVGHWSPAKSRLEQN